MKISTNAQTIIEDGGGFTTSGDYLVRFIDFKGNVIKEEWVNHGDSATAPTPPVFDYLTFDEWNKDFNNITRDLDVGTIYKTTSGETYLFGTFTRLTGLNLTLFFGTIGNGGVVVDWGDGNTETIISGNGEHTYSNYGDYIIKIKMVNDGNNYELYDGGYGGSFLENNLTNITSVYFGKNVPYITNYSFGYNRNLKYIMLPKEITDLNSSAFYFSNIKGCVVPKNTTTLRRTFRDTNIENVVLPETLLTIGDACFQSCGLLNKIIIPNSVTTIKDDAFLGCGSLKTVLMSENITILGDSVFKSCGRISKHNFYDGVNLIQAFFFYYNSRCRLFDFSSRTTVPTLQNINVFQGINDIAEIRVPQALYDTWISATNWVTYADYIVGV